MTFVLKLEMVTAVSFSILGQPQKVTVNVWVMK